MKLMWTGTDSLMMVDRSMRRPAKRFVWWVFSVLVKFLDRYFVQEHWVDHSALTLNLIRAGMTKPIKVKHDDHVKRKVYRVPHPGFNVLYYLPKGGDVNFRAWLYGKDIYEDVKRQMNGEVNFILVDGSQDMGKILPAVDLYIRPNRHDGNSRLVTECKENGIPVAHTRRHPENIDWVKEIRTWQKRLSCTPNRRY